MIKKVVLIFVLFISLNIFAEENVDLEVRVKKINEQILNLRSDLREKFDDIQMLYSKKAKNEEYETLFIQIKTIKEKIKSLEEKFRKDAVNETLKTDEGYAFWDQGETTISQLIMEYGSQDYLYVIPNEIGNIKINLFSTIPIPRENWNEMLKFVLSQNGIGVKKLNPFLNQLYILKHDPSYIEAIVCNKEDLAFLEDSAYLAYVFTPKPERMKASQSFLERFSDMKHTVVHAVKNNIIIVGNKSTVERLINLYSTVFDSSEGKIIKVITLNKVFSDDAEKILKAFFSEGSQKTRTFYQTSIDELVVLPAGKASIILIGEDSLISKAQKVILDLENQLDDPAEMTIFSYNCKNSDPAELAEILEKLYFSIDSATIETKEITSNSSLKVQPKITKPGNISLKKEKAKDTSNFIVDSKTNSILMVVRKDEIPKIKSLLKTLDVPKQMVQIDVLLVERKIQDSKQTGINLLKIGTTQNKKETAISFDASSARKGLFDFLISRPKGKIPSFDIALSFLMSQDDMRIADCPTILAVNQTPASISVVDEISINNGAIQIDTTGGSKLEKSFSRAQFGTTIVLTPTIHLPEDNEEKGFVTLHTDVSFDTTKSIANDRPSVTRRHIENEVRVADSETIILGGLRRKTGEIGSEKIPFLGEIPGIGKLFGSTREIESESEMFIFITPHIIQNPEEELNKLKNQMYQRRQGDSEEFIAKLENAKNLQKKKLFENSMKLFFEK